MEKAPSTTVTLKVAPAARPVTEPVIATPDAERASAKLMRLSPSTGLIVIVAASSTLTVCVTTADTLPYASVACALTVAAPLGNVTASTEGIVAVQAPFGPTVAE